MNLFYVLISVIVHTAFDALFIINSHNLSTFPNHLDVLHNTLFTNQFHERVHWTKFCVHAKVWIQ